MMEKEKKKTEGEGDNDQESGVSEKGTTRDTIVSCDLKIGLHLREKKEKKNSRERVLFINRDITPRQTSRVTSKSWGPSKIPISISIRHLPSK